MNQQELKLLSVARSVFVASEVLFKRYYVRIAQKMGYLMGMMLVISIISFLAIKAAPNSFMAAGGLNPNMTPEVIAHLKAVYGLDQTLIRQYFGWLENILTFDFGVSFVTGKEVIQEIKDRMGITLFINITTMIIVFSLAIWLGIKAALHQGSRIDRFVKQLSLFSFSMPTFYLALLLILLFSVVLEIFPISGTHSIGIEGEGFFIYYADMLWHLILPFMVIIFVSIGSMTMYVRSLTIEILKSDYINFCKARNLEQRKIIKLYIFPNLLPPIVTLLGLSLPGLLGGSVILETIFSIDGMGQLFYNSALSRDYPIIMGLLMITAFLTLLGNMIADLILLKLNPFFKRSNA